MIKHNASQAKNPTAPPAPHLRGILFSYQVQNETARDDTTHIIFSDNQKHKINAIKIVASGSITK